MASDAGHAAVDRELQKMEKKIASVYQQASKEMDKKYRQYTKDFRAKDKAKRQDLKDGKISQQEYQQWRMGQIMTSQRWAEMRDTLAQDLTNANMIAMDLVNEGMSTMYAIGHNYGTFQVEQGSLMDTSYTLYDRRTVERLLKDNPDLLPAPRVNIPKDQRWNQQKIQSAILQGILQGESIDDIARRLQNVTTMNHAAAVRNARTATTGAENAGRVDSYKRAQDMGISMKQQWLATLDGRTRHSHRAIDGEIVKVGEEFSNGCEYPGDPHGHPKEIYNCRCTLVPVIDGVDQSDAPRRSRLGNVSYDEWKAGHAALKSDPTIYKPPKVVLSLRDQIMNAGTVAEVERIMNSQRWFRQNMIFTQSATGSQQVDQLVDLTGLDVESARHVAAAYQRVYERYPQLIGEFDPPRIFNENSDTYAQCYMYYHGAVEINSYHFGRWASMVKEYEGDVAGRWHPAGTNAESVIIHELGHAIDGYLSRKGVLGGGFYDGRYHTTSQNLKRNIMRKLKMKNSDLKWELSEYGATNPREFFAEAFAEYMDNPNPRPIAAEFGRRFEELMRQVNQP